MVNNVNTNKTAYSYNLNNQTGDNQRVNRRTPDFSNVDRIEISIDALRASQKAGAGGYVPDETNELEEHVEELLEEYKNSGAVSQINSPDDGVAAAARMKLAAMKIAMRIAKGDNVPMQDHRFLAEYDSALYKAAMSASVVANNEKPETHESLADELSKANDKDRESLVSETETGSDAGSEPTGEGASEATVEARS